MHTDLESREAHRVLFIIEILTQVLRNAGKPELAVAARVCRTWTEVALNMLWEEMESPHPLMSLLGPIIKHIDGWDWERGFPSGDTTRFASYAKRVRSLSYCPESERGGVDYLDHMSAHVPARWLYYMASHNGPEYLLPQVRKIVWDSCNETKLHMIFPFLSPTIEDIRIRTWWRVLPTENELILQALATVLPSGVRVFHFIPHDELPGRRASEVDQSLLQPLDELQELRLPSHLMAPVMFKPGRLRVLEAACDVDSGVDVHALLSQLADTCPLLEHLRILFYGVRSITFPLIRPLIRCSKLRSLDMEYEHDFDLEATEVIEMGMAWRELEVLHIASRDAPPVEDGWWVFEDEPPVDPTGGLSLALLVVFAESFSTKLRKLGLKFSTQDIPAPPAPPVSFPNLEVLSVGSSHLDSDKAKVAKAFAFLSGILPKEVVLARSKDWLRRNSGRVFDPDSWWRGEGSWEVLSRMLSQGEADGILAGLDPVE